jgi:hypothetical protein
MMIIANKNALRLINTTTLSVCIEGNSHHTFFSSYSLLASHDDGEGIHDSILLDVLNKRVQARKESNPLDTGKKYSVQQATLTKNEKKKKRKGGKIQFTL